MLTISRKIVILGTLYLYVQAVTQGQISIEMIGLIFIKEYYLKNIIMLITNMSSDDKKKGIMRALAVKQRDDYFDLMQEIMILHQLKIGRPYLNSQLIEQERKEEKKKD